MSPLPEGVRGIEPMGTLTPYPSIQSLNFSIMKRSHSLTRSELFLAYDRTLIQRAKEMRKNPTPAEKKLWDDYLSTFPHRILRQRPIDHFIVDFFCAALRLVIEVDGEIHDSEQSQARDDLRSKILHSYGLQVVRVTNAEVMGDFGRACERIRAIAEEIPLTPLGRQGGFIVGEGNLKARSFVDCLTNSGHYRLNRTYCSNEIIRVSVRLPARVAVFYDDNETTLPRIGGWGADRNRISPSRALNPCYSVTT